MVFLFLSFLFIFFLQILYDHRINLRLCKRFFWKVCGERRREREKENTLPQSDTQRTRERHERVYPIFLYLRFLLSTSESILLFSFRASVRRCWRYGEIRGLTSKKKRRRKKIHTILFAFWGGGLTMVAVWGVKRDLDAGDLRWSLWVSGMGNWISKYPNLFYY